MRGALCSVGGSVEWGEPGRNMVETKAMMMSGALRSGETRTVTDCAFIRATKKAYGKRVTYRLRKSPAATIQNAKKSRRLFSCALLFAGAGRAVLRAWYSALAVTGWPGCDAARRVVDRSQGAACRGPGAWKVLGGTGERRA